MKTRRISPNTIPSRGAVLIPAGSEESPTPHIVDHITQENSTVCVINPTDDDFELSFDVLVSDWCEVLGEDAKALRREFLPTFQNVLVVDRDEDLLRYWREDLGEAFVVLTATGLAAALELLEREPVDTVLADNDLPDGNGISLLAEVRKRRPKIQRVLSFAGDEPDNLHTDAQLLDWVVLKPYSRDDILEALIRPLDREPEPGPQRH